MNVPERSLPAEELRTGIDPRKTSAKRWIKKNQRALSMGAAVGYLAAPIITLAPTSMQELTAYVSNKDIDMFVQVVAPQVSTLIHANNLPNEKGIPILRKEVTPRYGTNGEVREGLVRFVVDSDTQTKPPHCSKLTGIAYVDELNTNSDNDTRNKVLVNNWVSFAKDKGTNTWHVERRKESGVLGEGVEKHFSTKPDASELPLTHEDVVEAEETMLAMIAQAKTDTPIKVSN